MQLRQFKLYASHAGMSISYAFIFIFVFALLGCASQRQADNTMNPAGADQYSKEKESEYGKTSTSDSSMDKTDIDDHISILVEPEDIAPLPSMKSDSISAPIDLEEEIELSLIEIAAKELGITSFVEPESAVARKIIENYFNSKNREPGGHCLTVSKTRFEKAYQDVYGHSFYKDLPDSMGRSGYSPREVFDFLYFSTSGNHEGWLSLPERYRGKGNAGAIAFAGMGTLVDWFGIWTGKLKPGAPMQVWKRRDDYDKVVKGVSGINNKGFDPFGHSFIFLGYVRDEENKIVGIRMADQGYQSYRPLLPSDYEVWWAVNLSE
jgi:hypothetical protein